MTSLATSIRLSTSTSRASRRPRVGRSALALALFALLNFALPTASQARVTLYKANHRLASELLPYAEASMGSEGKVQLDPSRNSILLVGDDALIERTVDLLKAQDTAARTIQLLYEHVTQTELREHNLNIQWKGNYGHIILGDGKPLNKDGLHVRQDGLHVRLRNLQRSSEDRFQGKLMIMEGQSGRIATGRSVPIQSRSKKYGTHTEFITAESGFEAQPTVLGNGKIRLEIRPFREQFESNGQVAFTEASTLIVLSPGDSVVLGGVAQQTDETGTYGLSARERSDDQLLMITASFLEEKAGETVEENVEK